MRERKTRSIGSAGRHFVNADPSRIGECRIKHTGSAQLFLFCFFGATIEVVCLCVSIYVYDLAVDVLGQ